MPTAIWWIRRDLGRVDNPALAAALDGGRAVVPDFDLDPGLLDAAGAYVRRWVPELAGVPDRLIHRPSDMPTDLQSAAGCVLGQDYPLPIVDHASARERVLAAYRQGRA